MKVIKDLFFILDNQDKLVKFINPDGLNEEIISDTIPQIYRNYYENIVIGFNQEKTQLFFILMESQNQIRIFYNDIQNPNNDLKLDITLDMIDQDITSLILTHGRDYKILNGIQNYIDIILEKIET